MATISWPSTFKVETVDYGIEFDVQIVTTRSGKVYTYGLPGARWTATLSFPADSEMGQRPALEALLVSLQGGANRLALPHLGRPMPNGTLRGTPTLLGAHVAGATQLVISNASGTLKAGDIIGVPGQLIMVMADALAVSGNITVLTAPALFQSYTDGTAVTWNRPTSLWIPKNSAMGPFPYAAGRARAAFSVDFIEAGT